MSKRNFKLPTAYCLLYCDTLPTPLGRVVVGTTERGVARCGFLSSADPDTLNWGGYHFRPLEAWGQCDAALQQLEEFFQGRRRCFDLPLDLRGTECQLQVWRAMLAIPFGETRSYAQIAAAIGSPRSVRAVGQASGHNPVGIIVPCHRVVGSDGSLTGYASGLQHKKELLDLERRTAGVGPLKIPGL